MSSDWPSHKLGDVADVSWGDTKTTKAAYVADGYPAYSASGRDGYLPYFDYDRVGIVLSAIGADCGRTWLARGKWSCIKNTIRFWSISSELMTEYLYLITSSKSFWPKRGSAQPFISQTDARNLLVRVPPYKLQVAIWDLISRLDDRITLLQETNQTLEAIAQAIFKSWFVDFDPVRAKSLGVDPEGMDAETAALFPDTLVDSELGEIPAGWSWSSLRDIVAIFDSKRIPLSGSERSKRKGEYPYYGAAALMDYIDDYLFDGIYLLIGEDGSVADENGYPITQYVWGKFWVNNHAHVLQGKNGVSTEQLMLFLKRQNIRPYITGAVQAKLSQLNMWRIKFLNPGSRISKAFGEVIKPLFDAVRHNVDTAENLVELRDTLLPRLISGQLQIPDAEQAIETATVQL